MKGSWIFGVSLWGANFGFLVSFLGVPPWETCKLEERRVFFGSVEWLVRLPYLLSHAIRLPACRVDSVCFKVCESSRFVNI